ILLLSGHESHIIVDFMWLCKQNHIDILYLPAHLSYVLQPLDLGTFSPLKSHYRKEITDLTYLNNVATVKK
ncbi:DDE-domain-containing protein, partial [Tuber magnatum]